MVTVESKGHDSILILLHYKWTPSTRLLIYSLTTFPDLVSSVALHDRGKEGKGQGVLRKVGASRRERWSSKPRFRSAVNTEGHEDDILK